MTAKQNVGSLAPDGSTYVTITDGGGNLGEGSAVLGAVTQSGTWTVQPGNTANTTAWKVDGSAVTQPVSLTSTTVTGTVAVTESGTWTVQPGNTANTTAWKVDGSAVVQPTAPQAAATSGGIPSTARLLS